LEKLSGLTWKSLVVGIVVTVIAIYIAMLVNPWTSTITYAGDTVQSGGYFGTTNGAYISFFVLVTLVSIFSAKMKITSQEYSVILAMLMAGLLPTGAFSLPLALGTFANLYQQPAVSAAHLMLQPDKTGIPLTPPFEDAIFEPFLTGGGSVPWSAWIGPILSWSSIFICYLLLLLFLTLLMRKPIIETGRLTFPFARIPLTLIGMSEPERALPSILTGKSKWLWTGVLIGVIGACRIWAAVFLHTEPLGNLITTNLLDWNINLPPGGVGASIANALGLSYIDYTANYAPGVLALNMLLPLEALFSIVVIFFILRNVIGHLAAALGIISSYTHYVYLEQGSLMPQFKFHAMIPGAFIGLGVWAILLTRKHIISTLKSLFKGDTQDVANSPRVIWGGIILFSIVLVGLMYLAGMPVWLAIVLVIYILIMQIGFIVIRGQIGSNAHIYQLSAPTPVIFYDMGGFLASGTYESTACASTMLFSSILGGYTAENMAPAAMYMESFKVGFEAKTKPKDITFGIILATVIGVVLSCILYLAHVYSLGLVARSGSGNAYASQIASVRIGWALEGMEPDWIMGGPISEWWPWMVFGFVLTIVLSAIRTVWLGFPILPSVLPVALNLSGWQMCSFTPVMALILKFIIMRIGGIKLFSKTVPLWVGMAIGYWLGVAIPIAYNNLLAILGVIPSAASFW